MKSRSILFLFLASSAWAVPGCPGPLTLIEAGPNWLVYEFSVTGEQATHARIQWGLSSTSENTQWGPHGVAAPIGGPIRVWVGGLTPATTYLIDVSASNGGTTWCTPLSDTRATAAAVPENEQDPAPIQLGSWNPHIVTPRTGTTRVVDAGCTNFQTHLTAADDGDTITIPPGTTCDANNATHNPNGLWYFNLDGRVGNWITGTTCDSATDRCTKTAHGFADQAPIFFGRLYNYGGPPQGLSFGVQYSVKLVDANTFELSLTPGGATIDLVTNGAEILIAPNRNCTAEVIITTAGPATNFPPEGVRINDTDYSLATIRMENTNTDTGTFHFGWGGASCVRLMNIRSEWNDGRVPGVDADTFPIGKAWKSRSYNHNITFDRVVFKSANAIQRILGNTLDGYRIAFINSHIEGMSMWQRVWDATATFTASTASFTGAKELHRGTPTKCVGVDPQPQITGGTSTGNFYMSAHPGDCSVQVNGPSGLTVNCVNCTYVGDNPTNWPIVGGRFSMVTLSSGAITSGAFTSHTIASTNSVTFIGEGSGSWIDFIHGPGPIWAENNYGLDNLGITFYSTGANGDVPEGLTCTPAQCPHPYPNPTDILYRRNHMYISDSRIRTAPGYTGLGFYGHRQPFELKRGKRAYITGNIFNGSPVPANPSIGGPALALTPLSETSTAYASSPEVSDILVAHNTFLRVGMVASMTPMYPGGPVWQWIPQRRIKYQNNSIATDGTLATTTVGAGGEAMRMFGGQMFKYEQNTFTHLKGSGATIFNPAFYRQSGLVVQGNLLFLNTDSNYDGAQWSDLTGTSPNLQGQKAKQALDNGFTPGYTWRRNGMVCGYSNSGAGTELSSANCAAQHDSATDWRDLDNLWAAGETVALRRADVGFLGFNAGNYRLLHNSPFAGMGIDQDMQNRAQGKVTSVSARLTGNTELTLNWTAPDNPDLPQKPIHRCTGRVLSAAGAFVAEQQAAQTERAQSATIGSLSAATAYKWVILCESEQPTGVFKTL